MHALHEVLDVLRIQVAAVDNQQVLAAAGHVELASVEESEVTGAQVRPYAVGAVGVEPLDGLGRSLVIAGGDARAAQPDLTDASFGQLMQGLRVDDAHVDTGCWRARTHQADRAARRRRVAVLLERIGVGVEVTLDAVAEGGQQGHLRHAVRGTHGRRPANCSGVTRRAIKSYAKFGAVLMVPR